jgi:hypothetical protein
MFVLDSGLLSVSSPEGVQPAPRGGTECAGLLGHMPQLGTKVGLKNVNSYV